MAEVEESTFENFEEAPIDDITDSGVVAADVDEDNVLAPAYELPEIKLFGRWGCDDVHVADMSLAVCYSIITCRTLHTFVILIVCGYYFCVGLHCRKGEICSLHTTFGWPICCQAIPQGSVPNC